MKNLSKDIEVVMALSEKYSDVKTFHHHGKVMYLCQRLMHEVREILEINEKDEKLLLYAALLHDIGEKIAKENHHIHSRNLIITENDFKVFKDDKRKKVSLMVLAHREEIPREILTYSEDEQDTLLSMISVLRLADAIDNVRGEELALSEIKVVGDRLFFRFNKSIPEKSLRKITKKGALFEMLSGKEIIIK